MTEDVIGVLEVDDKKLKVGDKAIVARGRKIPIGVEGVIIGITESENQFDGTTLYRAGLALNDKHTVAPSNQGDGSTYKKYENVVWVNMANLDKVS